ncbi:MAG: glutaminyl-peptide cyclotransferase [Candidatus Binatia bacterium]
MAAGLALVPLLVAPARAQPAAMGVEVLAVYPHDARAFTQGLLLHDGALYESTGLVGRSSLRQVELASGRVLRQRDLPPPLFGEGLAWARDELIQLTWQNQRALRWEPATFAARGEWRYDGEGWGLCFDGTHLVQSDGSQRLFFRDPATFAIVRTMAVTERGAPVDRLNELECVGDTIYANVWMTDRIVAIAALNGVVRASIDAGGLLTPDERHASGSEAILNGIAHDPANNTFLLTGKLWPKLFRVRFVPR